MSYYTENPMIDETQFPDDEPELRDCKQCGESFQLDCHAAIEEEFCSDECTMMYRGVTIDEEVE